VRCPDCEAQLRVMKMGLIEVDQCDACGGTWFDEGEFGSVRNTVRPRDVELTFTPTGLPAGPCPRCVDATLAAGVVAPASVGRCHRCRGIWVPKPIRTAQERQVDADGIVGVLEIVIAVLQFFV